MIDTFTQAIAIEKKRKKGQPIYEQIRVQLQKIIEDECSEGERLPAVTALAERLEVNYRTIKSALDLLEKDGIIKFERNRTAVVNSRAGRLVVTQKAVLSFVRWCPDAFGIGIYEGINRYVTEHNLQCIMADCGSSIEKYISAIEHPSSEVDGMIIAPNEDPGLVAAIKRLVERGTKVVFVDCVLEGVDVSSVTPDHFFGAYMATKHLMTSHNRPVYYIGTVTVPSSCREWIKGWSQAMQEFNYTNYDGFTLDTKDHDHDQIVELVKEFLTKHKEETFSILAGNDYVAKDIYSAAEQSGLTIGKDVFVASFSDLPFAKRLPVPLTSIDENPERVGYEAAQVLYETIVGQLKRPVHRLTPVQMNIRESSTGLKQNDK